ncbi:hypothetical protein V1512DRAFT_258149, partial [Lipomyces arxii]|uniref:uncharacterized protein n=1 Tax=Lipomyces arxii TaxID=56418 RepID=UPI0034CD1C8E
MAAHRSWTELASDDVEFHENDAFDLWSDALEKTDLSLEYTRTALMARLQSLKTEVNADVGLAEDDDDDNGDDEEEEEVDEVLVRELIASNDAFLASDTPRPAVQDTLYMPVFDLPALKMFTDLDLALVSSTVAFGDDLIRTVEHVITVCHSESGLKFVLTLDINQTDVEVLGFGISRVVPLWASVEMGKWVKCCGDDVNAFLYGVSEYTRLCTVRTKVFSRILKSLADYVDVQHTNTIGLDRITLAHDAVRLVISWKFKFDKTGDVSSILAAHSSVPSYYNIIDTENTLSHMSQVFNTLIKTRGVYRASCIIARNLFEDKE